MVSKQTHRLGKAFALPRSRALGSLADTTGQGNASEAPAETLVVTPGAGAAVTHADLAADNSDEVDSRMSKIKEILGYAATPLLEKCELIAEWVHHAEAVLSRQVVQKPQGGRPEGGVVRAARELTVPGKTAEGRLMRLVRNANFQDDIGAVK
jgi:hypothetical protein